MKKKISFEMWLTVLFGGIFKFFRNIFSWKNKTPFWRVIWSILTICIVLVTLMLCYSFYREYYAYRYRNYYWNEENSLGDRYYFADKGKGEGYIYDRSNDKKVLEGIDWIARSEDGDSLVVFAKDGKRGYFNIYSGKTAIPALYDAAWVFNDGVAGVALNDSIFFIDHSGKAINDKKFKRNHSQAYCYHGEFLAISENGKTGLVDRNGEWKLKPVYDQILPAYNRFWTATLDGKQGVINPLGEILVPCVYRVADVYPESGIVITLEDYSKKRLDYTGEVIDDFIIFNLWTLEYESDEFDDEGIRKKAPANLFAYQSGLNRYGLMSRDGKPITPPLYSEIKAVSPNRYLCQIGDTLENLILDDNGNKVTE